MNVSIGHLAAEEGVGANKPSELLLRWMENMRMHFAVMCDMSAAILKI